MDPYILYYGKGQMSYFLADPDCVFDVAMSTEYRRQSSEGYPTKLDWSAEEREIKNKKATETRVRQVHIVTMT